MDGTGNMVVSNKKCMRCPFHHNIKDSLWKRPDPDSHLWTHKISIPSLGMLVLKIAQCDEALHVFFYRKGQYLHRTIRGKQKISSFKTLAASAVPPIGEPGSCRRNSPNFISTHRLLHRQICKSDGNGIRTTRNEVAPRRPRSLAAKLVRYKTYQDRRTLSRQSYRKWRQEISGDGEKFTLVHYPPRSQRVGYSPSQQTRAIAMAKSSSHPTPHSTTAWYNHYITPPRGAPPQFTRHRGLPIGGRNRKLHIVAWNVQNMKSITKLDQLMALMKKHKIDILIMSETNITTSNTFYKDGFQISYSGDKSNANAGVGFIISPHMRPFIIGFTPIMQE
jgi:hypothetical protein